MQDLRAAFRALARRPAFAVVAIATLALGMGGNAAIFSIIDTVLLRPLPYPRSDRLVVPWEYSADVQRKLGFDRLPSSPGDVTDYRSRNRTFERLASVRSERVNITGTGEPERLAGVRVSPDFFEALGVQPVIGRGFRPDDLPSPRLMLIGYGLWQRRFGEDAAVVNRTVSVNGEAATIIGVLPKWFRFPGPADLPAALGFSAEPDVWTLDILSPAQQRSRAAKSFALVGRLRDDTSLATAEADLGAIAADIARNFPESNGGWTVRVIPLREQLVAGVRSPLLVLLTAVGFVLLIACANVANLLLVRAAARQREMSIRAALGADRKRLLRQLLIESLVIAFAAGVVGLAIAWLALNALTVLSPISLPGAANAALDLRVVWFTLVVSCVTGIAFGLVPAFQATRTDVGDALREGARGTVGAQRAHRTRNLLVVVEVAMAVVLLVGAVLLIQTFVRLLSVDAGFRTDGLLTMEVALPRNVYDGQHTVDFFRRLTDRLSAVPGVQTVAVTSALPLTGAENIRQITIDGQPPPDPGQEIVADYRVVSPEYFRTMGIPQVSGEQLAESADPSAPVLLINSTMATSFWPNQSAIGKRLKLTAYNQNSPWFTVVGVVGDTRHTALDSALRPQVYVQHTTDPLAQMVVVMRTTGDPLGFAAVARAAVQELDRNQPIGKLRTMKAVVDESVSSRRFTMFLAGTFAGLALALSLVGLYAVVSFSVAERTREMGVRLALGASPRNLLTLVMAEGLTLAAAGVVLGLVAAFGMTSFMRALLFGVAAHDATTFVLVPLLLFAAAAVGCIVPARRAMRVDPMVTLRAE
jgi:putative ABC transport system permease protein